MANRRGRPPIPDQEALHRVAEYIVAAVEKGSRCSIRAAILRTSDQVIGNSSDAMLWRLQRKWRRHGAALLAEARERRAKRRQVASVPMLGGFLGGAADEIRRLALYENEVMRASRLQDEISRIALGGNEVTRAMDAIERIALCEDDIRRAAQLQDQIMRALYGG